MLQNWGFLLTEIWGLLALAGLGGLLAGWIIWSKRESTVINNGDEEALAAKDREIAQLRAELSTCQTDLNTCNSRVSSLNSDLSAATAAAAIPAAAVAAVPDGPTRPETLDAPRGGTADDLKRIKGVGPQMERICNSMGFWHFDQIAAWTDEELAWVDDNLASFRGRASRDNWVSQAKLLAEGGETEFSRKVDKGGLY